MNMNIFKYSLLGVCAIPVVASAQTTLADKQTQKVDLGFGVESTEQLTTAAATTITAEELQRTSAISLADALYGKILGLTALQSTGFKGEEGTGASFNIRGTQTTGEKGILILVDGYERPIDRLSVEEVESVTVLKDAAAVALYGHEAINGVLLVKTKHGAADGNHVKVGYSHKFNFDAPMAEMVNAYTYANALNRARQNDGLAPAYTADELAKFQNGSDPLVYPNVNWRDEAFGNTASENHAYISMFGGNQNVQYYTQLDYTDATGMLKNSNQGDWDSQQKYSKANIRANVDFKLSETTKVTANMLAIFMETNGIPGVSSNDAWWHLYKVPALAFPIKTNDGVWGGSNTYGDFNLLAKIQGTGFEKTHQRQIWANMTLEQDLSMLVNGLSAYFGGSYDNSSNTIETSSKGYQYGWHYYDAGQLQTVVQGTLEDKLKFNNYVDAQWRIATFNAGLKYGTQLNNGDNLAANLNYNIKGEIRDNKSNTWYRANAQLATHYDHADKFSADLVLAMNGSSRSYPSKWAFSPTLGLGYIFTPEGSLLFGKVRASGGIQHTDYVPAAGLWLSAWNNSNGQFFYGQGFSSSWGAFQTAFPTDDFKQETAYKANIGTDLRVFDMIDITFDAFYQKRTNILVSASALNSSVVGIQSSYDDKGQVSSYGFEAGIRYAKTLANGLNITAGAMITGTKSKINAWIENPVYPNLSIVGAAADAARGLIAVGLFKDQYDIELSPRQEFGQVKPGDIKYADVNEDGVVNEFDRVNFHYGTEVPNINYAANFGLEYKGIGFNAYFQGAGNQMKNIRYVDGVWGALSNNRNLSKEYYNNCFDIAGADAKYPRLSTEDVINNTQESSLWYQNVRWFKLRDCELYYKLPTAWTESIKIPNAKVYVQGQNLFSVDNVDAMDAENLSTGYPAMKSVNVGLSVMF